MAMTEPKELWSFRDQAVARVDLTGFELHARDGALGTVVQSFKGRGGGYLAIDPGVAMPLGRQVLVPVGLIEKVDVDGRRVSVKAKREQIKNAPAYERARPLDERSRSRMNKYYRPLMGTANGRGRTKKSERRTGARRGASEPTKAKLYAEAKRFGIEGRSKMNKVQLARAVGRRRGASSSGGRTQAKANPVEVQAFLEGVGYPTRKRELLREAESQGARQVVRATLRRLPDKKFESPTEVSEAIGTL